MKATLRLCSLASSVGVGLALFAAAPAHATQTLVPCGDITGLRNAINAANAAGSGDIALVTGCTYTITTADNPDNGLPRITGSIRLASFGGATVARSGPVDFRLFFVAPGGHLTLTQVSVAGGQPAGDGGAIYNQGSLTVVDSTIRNSHGGVGGGVYNDVGATAELDGATISDNIAATGGGLANSGQLRGINSTVRGNLVSHSGGGLFNLSGQATFVGGQITGNTAEGTAGGGGIYVGGGQVSAFFTNVSGNTPNNCRPAGAVAGCTG